jgi:hypothetical protein
MFPEGESVSSPMCLHDELSNGTVTHTSGQAYFKAADGAIVSTAQETATFFTALMHGKLLNHAELTKLQRDKLVDGGDGGCAGHDHVGSELGTAYRSSQATVAHDYSEWTDVAKRHEPEPRCPQALARTYIAIPADTGRQGD